MLKKVALCFFFLLAALSIALDLCLFQRRDGIDPITLVFGLFLQISGYWLVFFSLIESRKFIALLRENLNSASLKMVILIWPVVSIPGSFQVIAAAFQAAGPGQSKTATYEALHHCLLICF